MENELENMALHNDLKANNKQLIESIRTKNEMSAMISHDFINALAPIVSISDMLLFRKGCDESIISYLKIINKQGDKLQSLAKDFLDAFKLDLNQLQIRYSTVKTNDLINEVIECFKFDAEKENKVIRRIGRTCETLIKCDPRRVSQVLSNLV